MRSGELDRKITIQSITQSVDDSGGPTETASTYSTPWAKKIPLSGRETFVGDQIAAAVLVKYRLRYDSGITTQMRIVDTQTYNIRSIQEIGRREGLEIIAEVFNP